jgi:hypothetical protein
MVAGERSGQGQILWDGKAGSLGRSFSFSITSADGALGWRVKNRPVPVFEDLRRDRTVSRRGSFSLFTHDSVVGLGSLEIRGVVRREWVGEEAGRMAAEELRKLLERSR